MENGQAPCVVQDGRLVCSIELPCRDHESEKKNCNNLLGSSRDRLRSAPMLWLRPRRRAPSDLGDIYCKDYRYDYQENAQVHVDIVEEDFELDDSQLWLEP